MEIIKDFINNKIVQDMCIELWKVVMKKIEQELIRKNLRRKKLKKLKKLKQQEHSTEHKTQPTKK